LPAKWTLKSDGGLTDLFQSLYSQNDRNIPASGFMARDAVWQREYLRALAPFRLPLLAYEGGQQFAGGSTDSLNNLYISANRDRRMGQAYLRYFHQWKEGGGQLFIHYNDVSLGSKYGSWGALESIMQTANKPSDVPPKWQALQIFVSSTPCWWSNCSAAVDSQSASH
jgi:hypothetical protein